jgi:hypothetical protein
MLPTKAVISWLTSLGWDTRQERGCPIVMGPYIPKSPDRLCVLTPAPGPGYVWDGAADASAFQARVRGGQNDQPDAEHLALALDSLIFGASFPVLLPSGQVISHVHRAGGAPAPLGSEPDDGDRFFYVCSYLCIAST